MKHYFFKISLVSILVLSACSLPQRHETNVSDKSLLRVYAGEPGFSAYPYYDWTGGKLEGFEPEIITELARTIGAEIKFVFPDAKMKYPRIEMLERNKADVVIHIFTITPERAERVAFSDPYLTTGLGVIVAADSTITDIAGLQRATIFTYARTTAYDWAISNLPEANIITVPPPGDYITIADIVAAGAADACISDSMQLALMVAADDRIVLLPELLQKEQLGIAVRKDDTKLLAEINAALKEMKANGRYQAILEKWGLPSQN